MTAKALSNGAPSAVAASAGSAAGGISVEERLSDRIEVAVPMFRTAPSRAGGASSVAALAAWGWLVMLSAMLVASAFALATLKAALLSITLASACSRFDREVQARLAVPSDSLRPKSSDTASRKSSARSCATATATASTASVSDTPALSSTITSAAASAGSSEEFAAAPCFEATCASDVPSRGESIKVHCMGRAKHGFFDMLPGCQGRQQLQQAAEELPEAIGVLQVHARHAVAVKARVPLEPKRLLHAC